MSSNDAAMAVEARGVIPALREENARLRAALLEVVHHTYHGDKAKDEEGYWCLAGLQEEMRAVLDGVRNPRDMRQPPATP